MCNKAAIFQQYNLARKAAREGFLDPKRVDKALGILLSKNCSQRLEKYFASKSGCGCEDHARHPGIACKHMIACMILRRIACPKAAPQVLGMQGSNGTWYVALQINPTSYRLYFFPGSAAAQSFMNSTRTIVVEHPGAKWVQPAKAHGRRLQNDETALMPVYVPEVIL